MTTPPKSLWDKRANVINPDAFDHLSRMVAGNDELVTEPGLVQALMENRATPQQAGAINSFLTGLKAEQKVYNATGKIQLSLQEQDALDAMGVKYQHVLYTQQDAEAELRQNMAAQGLQPVLDVNGKIKTDAKGNPLAEQIPQPEHHDGGWFGSVGDFFSHLGHVAAVPFKAIGKEATALYHGDLYPGATHVPGTSNAFTPEQVTHDLQMGYQDFSAQVSQNSSPTNIGKLPWQQRTNPGDADLAKRLGYDPDSFFSMQAFKARGYAHNDTSDLATAWDKAHPNGHMGLSGQDAVTEAEVYSANPGDYLNRVTSDTSLTPEQVAQRILAISSPEFQTLAQQVNGSRSDIGADFANDMGIDPVKHARLYGIVSAFANLPVMIATDPLNLGLTAFSGAVRTSGAIKDLTDAGGIQRVFLPEAGARIGTGQARSIGALHDMVDHTNQLREAVAAGDDGKAAGLTARIQSNPFGGMLGDFMGEDQILGPKAGLSGLSSEEARQMIGKGDLPFETGKGEALDTYDKAVTYLASRSALVRLTGGHAPVETSVMPGAMSSRIYRDIKGTLGQWTAARGEALTIKDSGRFINSAKADPGKLENALNDRLLTHALPTEADAIDVLTGKVLSAQENVTEAQAAQRAAEEAAAKADPRIDKLLGKARGTNFTAEADAFSSKAEQLINNAEEVRNSRTATTAAQQELASARRAREEAALQTSLADNLVVTDAGRGYLRGNRLRYGLGEAPDSKLGRAVSIYTLGTAKRAQLLVSRFTNWLPRDTHIDVTQDSASDVIRKMSRTYMTSGDANMLALRWTLGDIETRKTIVEGLKDQLAHAAGLTRTQAGRLIVKKWKTDAANQKYLTNAEGFKDVNGVAVGMYPGNMRTDFALPSFGAIHKAAAKIGLYEATMGRLFGTTPVERLMIQWKLGALFTPVTAMRANLEAWLNSHAEGMFSSGVRAKAVLRGAGKLEYHEVHRSVPVDKILSLAPLQAAGRAYRHIVLRGMSEAEAQAILEMPEDLLHLYIHDQAAFHYAVEMDPGGVSEISAAARAGYKAGSVRFKDGKVLGEGYHRNGFEVSDAGDSIHGANLYAHNLAIRVNKAPHVAKAIIDRLRNPALDAHHVIDALESGTSRSLMKDSLFGKYYFTPSGKQIRAVTADERLLGKQQWADQITDDFRQVVTGRNGVLQKKLLTYIEEHGTAPHADWILKHIEGQNRPRYLLKPIIQVMPAKPGVDGLVQAILDKEGRGYQWMVERLIQRHSTAPLFAAAYGKSKVALEDFKSGLIEQGLSKEAAERATASIAAHQAWERVARMLDDPHMKSQLDVVGRSFFAFSRATTMMLRRWGSTFWRNPQQARRMMLAAEGAVHSGLVYKDETTGDWMFHFPASGVAQEVLMHAMSNIPGLHGMFMFPAGDFTGRVASVIPGSDNPFQYSTNPIVSVSGRAIADLMPSHRELFDMVDRTLNGTQGQGQGFFSTFEPSAAKKFTDALGGDGQSRDSLVSSAMVGSLYNLYAAGVVPGPNASPAEKDAFLGRLQTGIKSQLFLRAVLGMFSPASIVSPDNENSASKPDLAYAALGAQGLRDEYKILLNQVGGDPARATAIWTALHPDKLVYTQSGSQASSSRAVMPATDAALHWMNSNHEFIQRYKSIAAYFIPEQSANDPYSQAAYRAQLEEGLRERKTPQEFLDDTYIASASAVYYPTYDKYLADVAQAKAAGNETLAAQHRADWEVWSHNFKAKHLTFTAHTEASAENIAKAQGQFADLKNMLSNGDVPAGSSASVRGMVKAYENYTEFIRRYPGTTNADDAAKASARSVLQDYLSSVVQEQPQLTDLYNGVFRPLSGYNLADTGATG